MPFVVPEAQFDAGLHARRSLIKANHLEQVVLGLFKEAYHEFWGVADPPNGSIYTAEQMQEKIEAIGMQQAIQVMTAAAGLIGYINLAYPGAVPEKYASAAFDYTTDEFGIHITALTEDWAAPVPPEPDPETPPENPE